MSGFYDDGREQLLARTIPEAAGVFAIGVNEDYVYDATHTDFDIFAPYILLPEQELSNVSFSRGILDADDTEWLGAGAGIIDRSLVLAGVVIYFQLAGEGSLLAYINSASVGLPQTLTGVNVIATWAAAGILRI